MYGRLVIRGGWERLRSTMSFGMSGCVHAAVLGWVALYSAVQPREPARSAYDLEIKPYEKHLVWYDLRKKLPDVGPAAAKKETRPLRARVKFPQSIVAGEKDLAVPPQLIRMDAPKIDLPKALDLPNVLAVAPPPKPVKPFQPPAPVTKKALPPAALLPQAPVLPAAGLASTPAPFDAALPKPQARAFVPPPVKAALPAAAPLLPEAPQLRASAPELAAPRIPRGFMAPPPTPAAPVAAAEPAAPEAGMTAPVPAPATLAIVGLNPAKDANVPPPPGSHDAGFSGGPEVRREGASEVSGESAAVTVPGLVARGGGKDNPGSLMSVFAPLSHQRLAAEMAGGVHGMTPSPAPAPPPGPRAAHVSSAPDSRLKGRYIYTVAIQMPNVTSYSGSWIVWFADRDPATGSIPADVRPPVAVRKVDPKYIQTAVEDRIEGVVRLAAVILRDGHVQSVELLQHLDARLDQSAQEALAKWIFEPAMRNGNPIEVDAVFEIPFRLAPKPAR